MEHITPKDIKNLRNSKNKSLHYFVPLFIFLMALFQLIIGLWNLKICARIAKYDGLDLIDVFRSGFRGVDIRASYSGVYLALQERLTNSILHMGGAVFFVVLGVAFIMINCRNRRIIDYIDSKEKKV